MEVGDQRHTPAALPPGMTRYQFYRRLSGPQGRSGRLRKALEVGGRFVVSLMHPWEDPSTRFGTSVIGDWVGCVLVTEKIASLYRNSNHGTTTTHGRNACCPVQAYVLAIRPSSVGAFPCTISASGRGDIQFPERGVISFATSRGWASEISSTKCSIM
jgi:hypothetical protein